MAQCRSCYLCIGNDNPCKMYVNHILSVQQNDYCWFVDTRTELFTYKELSSSPGVVDIGEVVSLKTTKKYETSMHM